MRYISVFRFVLTSACIGTLGGALSFGQGAGQSAAPAAPAPQFEVVSVRPSPPAIDDWQKVGVHIDGAMVRCTYLSLKDYVGMAYNMKPAQINGPDWMGDAKFDIVAKLPGAATRREVGTMMQAVLSERFKMQSHRESKEFPVYALSLGKGPLKLKEAATDPETPNTSDVNVTVSGAGSGPNSGAVVDLGGGSYVSSTGGKIVGHRVTIAQLLESVGRFLDRPVVNLTNLNGVYDVTVQYSLEELRNVLRSTGVNRTIPDSAADQFPGSLSESFQALGLKLEARKAPLDILVIDHVEKTPVEN